MAPSRAKAKRTSGTLVLVVILALSLLLVSWFIFASMSVVHSHGNSDEAFTTRSLSSQRDRQDSKDFEATRWKKYKNVYKYKGPRQSEFSTADECGEGPTFADFFDQGRDYRSRYNEDKLIYKAFFKERLTGTGTYVELGAYDGQHESNSRFYDICLGWKGLLIEGNPSVYGKTVANRPQAHKMSFAPSCKEDGAAQFYKYKQTNAGLAGKAVTYNGKPTVPVPCGPLGPVLEDVFKGETINFFSLDVEGAEPQVLETIDFDKVKIDVLMVEVDNYFCKETCEYRDAVREIMNRWGYIRHDGVVRASDVFVHPRTTFSLIRGWTSKSDPKTERLAKYRGSYKYKEPSATFQSAPKECGEAPVFKHFFKLPAKEHSLHHEDSVIYKKFFKGRLNGPGTYVELGSHNGQADSNSRFFDICLGWKGLLIEGNPQSFERTLKFRPRAHSMSFSPTCKENSTVQFYNYPMANSGLEGKALAYEGKPTIDVPCGPLGPVLKDIFGKERINFLSLDVEGSESMVLETIDFQKTIIDVLVVEVDGEYCHEECENRENVRSIMEQAGYKRFDSGSLIHASDVYVHPDSPYQALID